MLMRLPMLVKVDVSGSFIRDLGPPAMCSTLQALNCSDTTVSSLAPLTTGMHHAEDMNCCSKHLAGCVSSLDALATCTALTSLDCVDSQMGSLSPLSECTALTTLLCHGHRMNPLFCLNLLNGIAHNVVSLDKCTKLTTLDCNNTAV